MTIAWIDMLNKNVQILYALFGGNWSTFWLHPFVHTS